MIMPTTPRQYTIGELLTDEELNLAFDIIRKHHLLNACNDVLREESKPTVDIPQSLNDVLIERVITPAMPRINEKTGQENYAPYFAYVLQYAFAQTMGKAP